MATNGSSTVRTLTALPMIGTHQTCTRPTPVTQAPTSVPVHKAWAYSGLTAAARSTGQTYQAANPTFRRQPLTSTDASH